MIIFFLKLARQSLPFFSNEKLGEESPGSKEQDAG